MPERLALYTTIYPGVEKFLPDWYRSVLAQTDREFDLWAGLDSLDPATVCEATGAKAESLNFVASERCTPAQIRQHAIQKVVDNYSAIVFVDCDDLLYPTRIEAARETLKSSDVAGCALSIIDEDGRDLGITFGETNGERLSTFLPQYNVFGLSNTAYRSEVLQRCLPLGDDCELVDWLLATRAWASGAELKFDPKPQMAYRQYSRNIANVLVPFSAEQILAATSRVVGHYRCLLEGEYSINGSCGTALQNACDRATSFQTAITSSSTTLDKYVAELNQIKPRYVWWWCVANPELEHLWKN